MSSEPKPRRAVNNRRASKRSRSKRKSFFVDYFRDRIAISSTAFYVFRNGGPVSFGSGVFLVIGNRCFIVTAAHVGRLIDQNTDAVLIPSNSAQGNLECLRFERILYPVRRENIIDVCVVVLSGTKRDYTKGQRRLVNLSKIGLVDAVNCGRTGYIFVGLPSEHSNMNVQKESPFRSHIDSMFLLYDTVKYRKKDVENYDGRAHILLSASHLMKPVEYKGRKPNRVVVGSMPTKLSGVSGSGIWRYIVTKTRYGNFARRKDLKLIGIQHSVKQGAYIKGTKIGFALSLIYNHYVSLPDPLRFYRKRRKGIFLPDSRWL